MPKFHILVPHLNLTPFSWLPEPLLGSYSYIHTRLVTTLQNFRNWRNPPKAIIRQHVKPKGSRVGFPNSHIRRRRLRRKYSHDTTISGRFNGNARKYIRVTSRIYDIVNPSYQGGIICNIGYFCFTLRYTPRSFVPSLSSTFLKYPLRLFLVIRVFCLI